MLNTNRSVGTQLSTGTATTIVGQRSCQSAGFLMLPRVSNFSLVFVPRTALLHRGNNMLGEILLLSVHVWVVASAAPQRRHAVAPSTLVLPSPLGRAIVHTTFRFAPKIKSNHHLVSARKCAFKSSSIVVQSPVGC